MTLTNLTRTRAELERGHGVAPVTPPSQTYAAMPSSNDS
jgi:hypothetical protein